jgi:hypothetical protein
MESMVQWRWPSFAEDMFGNPVQKQVQCWAAIGRKKTNL